MTNYNINNYLPSFPLTRQYYPDRQQDSLLNKTVKLARFFFSLPLLLIMDGVCVTVGRKENDLPSLLSPSEFKKTLLAGIGLLSMAAAASGNTHPSLVDDSPAPSIISSPIIIESSLSREEQSSSFLGTWLILCIVLAWGLHRRPAQNNSAPLLTPSSIQLPPSKNSPTPELPSLTIDNYEKLERLIREVARKSSRGEILRIQDSLCALFDRAASSIEIKGSDLLSLLKALKTYSRGDPVRMDAAYQYRSNVPFSKTNITFSEIVSNINEARSQRESTGPSQPSNTLGNYFL